MRQEQDRRPGSLIEVVAIGLISVAMGAALVAGSRALANRPARNFGRLFGRATPTIVTTAATWWLDIVSVAFAVGGLAQVVRLGN
jgi:hypothetical protein